METKNNIYISNKEGLIMTLEKIKQDGPGKVHILTDFDRTLTTARVDGISVPSLISILRDGNYLTSDYATKAHALYNHYAPFETDQNISKEERTKAMDQWWRAHFKLLIECELTKSEVDRAIDSGKIKFRDGVLPFLKTLQQHNVPVVIMSSSSLGGEAIERCLKREKHYFDNINIISNTFIWDEYGKAMGVQEPIIHGMSKEETAIQNFPVFKQIKDRPNVILLGDNLSDVGMVTGFDYTNLIKIGFLNENTDKHLKDFQQSYDITITNDGTFEHINKILNTILN